MKLKPSAKRELKNKINSLERKLKIYRERLTRFGSNSTVGYAIQGHIKDTERDLENAKFSLNRA
jgi:hypothetical protein